MRLSAVSFGVLFIAYFGWIADVVLGPIAMATSVAAVVQALRRRGNRYWAFGALLAATPAFAWAVYALMGGSAT